MPVRVPFHLRRRPEPAPAAGLLLGSDDPAGLLVACARLHDPLVFPVRGGFLVIADAVPAVPNAVRLRRLSENCYLPADADLVPALLPAEAVDLTATRGLVFLPGRDPLAFDARCPLRPAAFLAILRPRRDDWEPFPAGHPPAERLTAIVRVLPDPPLDDLLGGGSPIGTDDARPPDVGLGRRAVGRLSTGLGKGLGGLGRLLGSKKLGNLGDKLKEAGTKAAPRISEDLLGKQEAALQRLLKKFRQGNTDDALRHAVPVGKEPGRGSQIHNSAQLPTHGLFWSLAGLFGGGGGRSSIWAGGNPDTWRDLIAEYRRAAQAAADRGDFRRAALIYAKLLSDFRAAAEVLSRGGLHREAGILFRDKVMDGTRAAREFEQAGDPDEALRLYRRAFLYIDAGDLLRRLGEEDLAVAEYHRAAERVVEIRSDHVEAGDILLKKTGRPDLAGAYFARGWEARGKSLALARNAAPCAERLIELYAFAEPRDPFWTLLGEAEAWLREPGQSHDAGRFFNKVAGLAELPHLMPDRGEIRDRCRLGLANKLRQHTKFEPTAGTAVTDLFGTANRWSPAVVSDADFAVRSALKLRPKENKPVARAVTLLHLHAGEVTAAAHAPDSGDLYVGFRDGTVINYDPTTAQLHTVAGGSGDTVLGLAPDLAGQPVAVLRTGTVDPDSPIASFRLEVWVRRGTRFYRGAHTDLLTGIGTLSGLLPVLGKSSFVAAVGVSMIGGVTDYTIPDLIPQVDTGPTAPLPPTTYLKLRIPEPGGDSTLTFQGGSVAWDGKRAYIGWMPDPAPGSTLFTPPVAWLVASPTVAELAGLFDTATLYWSSINRQPDGLRSQTLTFKAPGGFRAVGLWQPGKVIGVSSDGRVVWLRARGGRFEEWAVAVVLPGPSRAVACFPSRRTGEALVVLEDGTLARVPVPG